MKMPNSSTISFKVYLVWFFGLYVLGISSFFVFTEWMIRNRVEPHDNVLENLRLMTRPDIQSIAVGDSHVALGFDGENQFFTVGFPGENLLDTQARIEFLLHNSQLKKVILQADPHMFSEQRLQDTPKAYLKNLNEWLGMNPGAQSGFLRTLEPYHRGKLLLYWKTFLFGTFQNAPYRIHPNGWIEMGQSWSKVPKIQRRERALQGMKTQIPASGGFQYQAFHNLFNEIIDQLMEKGIDTCLVTFPVASEYYELAAQHPAFQKEMELFDQTARSKELKYVNGFGRFAEEKYISYFSNEDHLGPKGAKQFSAEVMEACFQDQ